MFAFFCMLYTVTVFGAEMTASQFFDFNHAQKVTRIQIQQKTTGSSVNITNRQEIERAYTLLKNTKFSQVATYDAYTRNHNMTTGDYVVTCYEKDAVQIKFDVTQEKIYNEKWVLIPEKTPLDFYYFARYMVLTKPNYQYSFTEEDFQKNSIFWKESPVIFQKNQPYYDETNGVMAELQTLNRAFGTNADYDINTQTISAKEKKATLFGVYQNDTIYVAVQPFAEFLGYDVLWDDDLKILSIKENKNDNALWEALYGKPAAYGTIDTVFENGVSFQSFLNIDTEKPFSKIVIENQKTNHMTVITDENHLQQAEYALKNTAVYQIMPYNAQAQQGLLRYKVTLYQSDEAVKELFFTSENFVRDNTHLVGCSTAFFDWFYKMSEIDYAKAILLK